MQPMLIQEYMGRDRLVEVVTLSHEAVLRAESARSKGPRASVGAALVRAGLKLNPTAAIVASPRSC